MRLQVEVNGSVVYDGTQISGAIAAMAQVFATEVAESQTGSLFDLEDEQEKS
jgi:hypothetical protein